MQNKVIQSINTKIKKEQNNTQKENNIIKSITPKQSNQDEQITSNNKNNNDNQIPINTTNKNRALANTIKKNLKCPDIKTKLAKKNCSTNNQIEIKNINKIKKEKGIKVENEGNLWAFSEGVKTNISKNNKKSSECEEPFTNSDNNLIKIKAQKKKSLDVKVLDKSDSGQDFDSLDEEKSKKVKSSNIKFNNKLLSEKDKSNGNEQIENLNYKKYNSVLVNKQKDKKENIKSSAFKEKNKKNKNKQDDLYDEIIVNENEFDISKNIQVNDVRKSILPKLSVNPFSPKSIRVDNIQDQDNINNNKIEEESLINKEKLVVNHHIKSSTMGTNNKSSTAYSNSSNFSSTVEILNANTNASSKRENTKINWSSSETEKKYRDLLSLAKAGDKNKFSELFEKISSSPKNLVDMNYQDENGFTALHYSCDEGNLKIVEILLNANCDPNIKNNEKETPLHLASKHGYFDISKLLIENGAIINSYNSEKNTPFHYVCMNNHVELLKYFLTKDPAIDSKNIYGKLPIDLTTNKEIKELLKKYIDKNENKLKKSNTLESDDSKIKKMNLKNCKTKEENDNIEKITLYENNKNIININIKNRFKKNKTSTSPFCKSPKNKVINKNIENNPILESPETNLIKRKNTITKNSILNGANRIRVEDATDDIQDENKVLELHSSKTIIKDYNKNNMIMNLKGKELKIDNKERNYSLKRNRVNYNTKTINVDKGLAYEIKQNKTKTISNFSSSMVKDKINKSKVCNSVNKGYSNFNEYKINNIKVKDSMNQSLRRMNLNDNQENKKVNKSFSKTHRENISNNQPPVKSRFYDNNLKTKKLLLDSMDLPNKNMAMLNKTEENIKTNPKKESVFIQKSVSNNIKNSGGKLETTQALLTKNKVKINFNKKKGNKEKKEKNGDNSLINNCNLSKISSVQKKNNLLLDTINKSNIVDRTLADNIHNKLDLNSIEEEKITPSNFICLAQLGKGSFGEVYLVQKNNTKEKYAMKVLRKERVIGQNLLKYAIAERNVLSLSHHPFIVKLHFAFQTSTKLFLILDYCPNGDLAKHLLFEKRFSEQRAKFYLCEVLLALENLHKRDIIFRDLKPDNVVLDKDGHCKLTDFGLSKEGVNENVYAQSFCGSIAYLAPEMLKKRGHGKAVDWYLLGVLFYEMLVGITPFFTLRKEDIFHNIEYGELNIPDIVSKEAAEVLRGLLERDPNKRLGGGPRDAQEIKEHPYFKDVNWDDVYNKKIKPPIYMNYMSKMIRYYNKPRLFANDDFFNKTADVKITNTNMLKGWSFVNNEDL